MDITLEPLGGEALKTLWKSAFEAHRLHRPESYYDECLAENAAGTRITLLALADGQVVGCAHLKYTSSYPYFKDKHIPEISDMNVFPEYRKRGTANKLMDEFERIVGLDHNRIGIGVGLYKDYGAAQRIYCQRGYVPDGNGVMYRDIEVVPGQTVRMDDELVLYFVKELDYD
ncbi:GNAT family N-acetyltransferase [Paenibacillus sacheonensis]|uniref:GNAT family N-acetyltransferase n=1 Tax=Paenibacillus sacheonensis TaxID=742054 RepID=A0A7X4YT84_9BACL|nr:GNAT family N-acetyltransferase [Paenibacillus sacheonensis]MBM7568442.1 GNAT superfamily N-acetyltransferase [Paenibacillus sacheonensis]NBC72140.1 GNAT family N-acetyltransferase [Paenibacillus sacheonensis]